MPSNKHECTIDHELVNAATTRVGEMLHVHSPHGSTYLHKIKPWPPNKITMSDSLNCCVFTGRAIVTNFIPIQFEMIQP